MNSSSRGIPEFKDFDAVVIAGKKISEGLPKTGKVFVVSDYLALKRSTDLFYEYLTLPFKIKKRGFKPRSECLTFQQTMDKLTGYLTDPPKYLVVDVETEGLIPKFGNITVISFMSDTDDIGYWYPLKVVNEYSYVKKGLDLSFEQFDQGMPTTKEVFQLKELFSEVVKKTKVVGHNLKFDLKWLSEHGYITKMPEVFDTMAMAFFLFSKMKPLKLKVLSSYLFEVDSWDDRVDDFIKAMTPASDRCYGKIPTSVLGEYAGLDVFYTRELFELFRTFLTPSDALEIIFKAIPIFADLENKGMHINKARQKETSKRYENIIFNVKEKIHSLPSIKRLEAKNFQALAETNEKKAKRFKNPDSVLLKKSKVNLNSYRQKSTILYEVFGLPGEGTDKNRLQKHLSAYTTTPEAKEFIESLMEYNAYNKIKTTYIDGLLKKSWKDFYLADFNLLGTVTGRLSSPFHTMPSRNKDIKSLFDSRFGDEGFFLSIDYSQLELAILGHMSEEDSIIETFNNHEDMHAKTAALIFNKDISEITGEERSTGKTINFAISYQSSAKSISESLMITESEAEKMMENFFAKVPKLYAWMEKQKKDITKKPWIKSPSGRFIPIPDILSEYTSDKASAKRCSINYQSQGFGSDIVLFSLINYYPKLANKRSCLIGTVHDSVQFDLHYKDLFYVLNTLKDTFENLPRDKFNLCLPLYIDFDLGLNWGEACSVSCTDQKLLLKGKKENIENTINRMKNLFELEIVDQSDETCLLEVSSLKKMEQYYENKDSDVQQNHQFGQL